MVTPCMNCGRNPHLLQVNILRSKIQRPRKSLQVAHFKELRITLACTTSKSPVNRFCWSHWSMGGSRSHYSAHLGANPNTEISTPSPPMYCSMVSFDFCMWYALGWDRATTNNKNAGISRDHSPSSPLFFNSFPSFFLNKHNLKHKVPLLSGDAHFYQCQVPYSFSSDLLQIVFFHISTQVRQNLTLVLFWFLSWHSKGLQQRDVSSNSKKFTFES